MIDLWEVAWFGVLGLGIVALIVNSVWTSRDLKKILDQWVEDVKSGKVKL